MKQSTGTFVISLDFELYWGMVDVLPLADHKETLLRTREVIPQLLGLFDAYQIHTTWATVGFLFAKVLRMPPKMIEQPMFGGMC